MNLQVFLRRVHATLGIGLGLVICVLAGTGTLLVFQPEIESGFGPEVEWDGESVAPWQTIQANAQAARPDHRLQMIWFPSESNPHFKAAFEYQGKEYTDPLYFHPASGRRMEWEESSFFPTVEAMHETLLLGSFGSFLVQWSSVLFSVALVSGLCLWWPGWKLKRWFSVGKGKRLRLDLHKLLGWTSAPFLLAMIFSGAVWSFPGVVEPLVYRALGETPPPVSPGKLWLLRSEIPPGEDKPMADPAQMVEHALRTAPEGAFPFYLSFPIHPDESVQVRLQYGYEPFPDGEIYRFYFDAYSGELLGEDLPSEGRAARYLGRWNAALHFGTIGGWPTRALYALACGCALYLSYSGVRLFVARKSREKS